MGHRVFSKLDIASGYYQIGIEEGPIEKTEFCINMEHWELLVMSFVLCNSPATSPCVMNHGFPKELNSSALLYLESVLI